MHGWQIGWVNPFIVIGDGAFSVFDGLILHGYCAAFEAAERTAVDWGVRPRFYFAVGAAGADSFDDAKSLGVLFEGGYWLSHEVDCTGLGRAFARAADHASDTGWTECDFLDSGTLFLTETRIGEDVNHSPTICAFGYFKMPCFDEFIYPTFDSGCGLV